MPHQNGHPYSKMLENRIEMLRSLRTEIEEAQRAAESIEAEGTDDAGHVWLSCRASGVVTELFIEEEWYRECTATELAAAVLAAHDTARSTVSGLVEGSVGELQKGGFDDR